MGPLIDKTVERFDGDVQTVFAISPFGASETRAQRLERFEALGLYDPNCEQCRAIPAHPTLDPFMPRHRPGSRCRSGGRPHCTCPTCWG
jgi:hypothetical protein